MQNEPDKTDARRTLDVPEVAKLLGIGRDTAYEAVASGEIPSIRLGRRIVVPEAALERLLSGEATVAT